MTPTHVDLFSGIGGFSIAAHWAGFETLAHCEIEPYPCAVLRTHWPDIPICGDVHEFTDWFVRQYGGREVDLLTGGFPCQDISAAGRGKGLGGARSGLWFTMLSIVRELEPRYVVAENVPALYSRGIDTVLAGMEASDYDVEAVVVGAWAAGAPHRRDRVFIVGERRGGRRGGRVVDADLPDVTPRAPLLLGAREPFQGPARPGEPFTVPGERVHAERELDDTDRDRGAGADPGLADEGRTASEAGGASLPGGERGDRQGSDDGGAAGPHGVRRGRTSPLWVLDELLKADRELANPRRPRRPRPKPGAEFQIAFGFDDVALADHARADGRGERERTGDGGEVPGADAGRQGAAQLGDTERSGCGGEPRGRTGEESEDGHLGAEAPGATGGRAGDIDVTTRLLADAEDGGVPDAGQHGESLDSLPHAVKAAEAATSWPTPTATDANMKAKRRAGSNYKHGTQMSHLANSGVIDMEDPFAEMDRQEQQRQWPTPTTQDGKNNGSASQQRRRTKPLNVAATWPTPTATDAKMDAPYRTNPKAGGPSLANLAHEGAIHQDPSMWLTPTAEDHKTDGEKSLTAWIEAVDQGGRPETPYQRLRNQAIHPTPSETVPVSPEATWPTPTAMTDSGGSSMSKWGGSGSREMLERTIPPEEMHGMLNPDWVEQLMGLPVGWTRIASDDFPGRRVQASRRRSGKRHASAREESLLEPNA